MNQRTTPTILLVYPSSFYYPMEQERFEIKSSLLLLGSFLVQYFPVIYADFEITIGRPTGNIQIKRFERQVKAFLENQSYDILAISCWTSLSYMATMSVAKIARELYPEKLVVVGGYHPSAIPEDFLTADNIIDYVIKGEGELALMQIAENYPTAKRPSETKIVAGATILPENFIGMNWDIVESFLKTNFPAGLRSVALYLSRGCPFDCSFCMESLKERRWHPYPPEMAVNEVNSAAEQLKVSAINLGDACFGLQSRWRKEFFTRLIERNPNFWITFETRPELFDEEDVKLLSHLKVAIELGVESFSPYILGLMNKTKNPQKFLDDFRKTSSLLNQYGIVHMANLIFNHPGETERTLQETFAVVDELIDISDSYLIWACHDYMHYPGSFLDRNKEQFEKEYGTRILVREWWKVNEDQLVNCRKVIPSSGLSDDKLKLWRSMYKERENRIKNSLHPDAFQFAAETYSPSWRRDPRYRPTTSK
jgi:radical SAM superfamily enzyme YgiQ (UPF0313 family)